MSVRADAQRSHRALVVRLRLLHGRLAPHASVCVHRCRHSPHATLAFCHHSLTVHSDLSMRDRCHSRATSVCHSIRWFRHPPSRALVRPSHCFHVVRRVALVTGVGRQRVGSRGVERATLIVRHVGSIQQSWNLPGVRAEVERGDRRPTLARAGALCCGWLLCRVRSRCLRERRRRAMERGVGTRRRSYQGRISLTTS